MSVKELYLESGCHDLVEDERLWWDEGKHVLRALCTVLPDDDEDDEGVVELEYDVSMDGHYDLITPGNKCGVSGYKWDLARDALLTAIQRTDVPSGFGINDIG